MDLNFDQFQHRFIERYGFVPDMLLRPSITALDIYAGNLELESDRAHAYSIRDVYAEVSSVNSKQDVDSKLLAVRNSVIGKHENILSLREVADQKLSRLFPDSKFRMLTILPAGIFVGEPEDLRNLFYDQNNSPLYNVQGFGERIAEIKLFSQVRSPGVQA